MGVFVRSDLEIDPTSLQLQAMPMTVEDFTNLFAESQEMPDELRSSGTYQSKNVVWTLYTIEKPDRYGDIAIGESDGLTLFILMRSVPAEREVLIQAVFVPAMDALVAITGPEVDATNQFLETLKKKDYTATTALVTDELLSAAGGVKGVETWLKQHKIVEERNPTHAEFLQAMRDNRVEFTALYPWQMYGYDSQAGTIVILEDGAMKAERYKAAGLTPDQ